MNRRIRIAPLLALLACDASGSMGGAREGTAQQLDSTATLGEAAYALRGEQLIAHLSPGLARQMCRQAAASIDLCHVAGRRASPFQCASTVAACTAQSTGPTTDCSDARFDFPEPCRATVDEYLECVAAWGAQQSSCEFDRIGGDPTPSACLPLLQHCPYLESEFGLASAIVPSCDPSSPPRVDDNDDIVGFDPDRPAPARMVTLGDSIAACFWPPPLASCSPSIISDYVREQYVPNLAYRSLAVSGARTADVLMQANLLPPGPGHLWVWLYVGGNDLTGCRMPTLEQSQTCVDSLLPNLSALWSQIFAIFDDPQRFPDGVTFLVNTQYSLWDQCVHPLGPERGEFADTTIRRFNEQVVMQAALGRPNVIAVDQYPDFLGHASNADRQGCPHCSSDDNRLWLADGTHPNVAGHQHIADKWKLAIDRMLSPAP